MNISAIKSIFTEFHVKQYLTEDFYDRTCLASLRKCISSHHDDGIQRTLLSNQCNIFLFDQNQNLKVYELIGGEHC